MPRPNGDNSLTIDKLKLRSGKNAKITGFDAGAAAEDPSGYEVAVKVKGPEFELDVSAKGPAWLIRKVLQDLDNSIGQLW